MPKEIRRILSRKVGRPEKICSVSLLNVPYGLCVIVVCASLSTVRPYRLCVPTNRLSLSYVRPYQLCAYIVCAPYQLCAHVVCASLLTPLSHLPLFTLSSFLNRPTAPPTAETNYTAMGLNYLPRQCGDRRMAGRLHL